MSIPKTSVFLLFFSSILFAQTFTSEYIDETSEGNCSLKLDKDGYARIAYRTNHLKYAWQDASGWHKEDIDISTGSGVYSDITLDSKGNPHILEYDDSKNIVKYCSKESGGLWINEELKPYDYNGKFCRILTDQNDTPHVIFEAKNNYDSQMRLIYGKKANAIWSWYVVTANLFPSKDTNENCDIVLDEFGLPYITFFENDYKLYCSHFTGSSFKKQMIDSNTRYGSAICYDNANKKLWIVYGSNDFNNQQLKLIEQNEHNWVPHTKILENDSRYPRMALDLWGNPHLSFLNTNWVWNINQLYYEFKNEFGLNTNLIGEYNFANNHDIDLNLIGEPHICLRNWLVNKRELVYIRPKDYGPKEFSLLKPSNGRWEKSRPSLFWFPSSYLGKGLKEYELWVDGSMAKSGIPSTRPFAQLENSLSDGWHTWQVKAKMSNGSEIWSTESWSFRVDAAAPDPFSLAKPIDDDWVTEKRPTFSWMPSGDAGSSVERYQIIIDENLAKENIASATKAQIDYDLADGPHQWYVNAIDQAGNKQKSQQTWRINIDCTPPEVFELSDPIDNLWTSNTSSTFKWNPSLDKGIGLTGYALCIESAPGVYKTYSTAKESTQYTLKINQALTFGSHQWYVKALDFLGNSRETDRRIIKIDNVPPEQFSLNLPQDSAVVSFPTPEFSWLAATDGASGLSHYELWIDNELYLDNLKITKTAPSKAVSEGKHSWYILAVDNVGNTKESPVRTFWGEWNLPSTFNLISPANNAIVMSDSVHFVWNSSKDSGSGLVKYQLWIDGFIDNDNISPSDTTARPSHELSIGEHFWYIIAVDKAGNKRTSTSVNNFSVTSPSSVDATKNSTTLKAFNIYQNYPNPFNSITTISYDVPEPSIVKIQIFNLSGQLVYELNRAWSETGSFKVKWSGTDLNGEQLPTGIYICNMAAANFRKVIKISLLK
jgi:hypothetical protein